MKRLPVPTAPSERAKWQTAEPGRSAWLILTLLLSLIAGFTGSLMADVYELDLTPTAPNVIVVPDNTSSASASLVAALQNDQADALVLIRDENTILGNGIVQSGDGWIVAVSEIFTDQTTVTIETNAGKKYTSDQMRLDATTGLAYIHVNTTGLRIAQFRDKPVELGESLIVYGRNPVTTVAYASVSGLNDKDIILDRTVEKSLVGAPIYDLTNAMVGFATNSTKIIPIELVAEPGL
ncbi:MAG: hypothetical protein WCV88_04135 [Patescibacteria group bacterium]|jgi:S1-C subfamily serine protease